MVSEADLYRRRAEDKLLLGQIVAELSTSMEAQRALRVPAGRTFFNDVIALCYYAIFYAAKAYLLGKAVRTVPPEEHKKTYEEFAVCVRRGALDGELLNIYDDAAGKAEDLLNIFLHEKRKRGRFTYQVSAQANRPFAQESLENAKRFVRELSALA